MADLLPPLKPIAIKERLSVLFIEKGNLDVLDGAFVVVDKTVADIYKFETVVPVAFKIASKSPHNPEQQVRLACRDIFRETRLLERIIPGIEEMLAAGEISPQTAPEEAVAPAIPNPESLGDAGHRS